MALQTTCYNFTGTKSTGEQCAGVVKPVKIDLWLSSVPELQPAFTNQLSGSPKTIECVRVDGAGDEGPAHLEVQFWWTVRHMEESKLVTMVTSRSSGSSFLNRTEWLPVTCTCKSFHTLHSQWNPRHGINRYGHSHCQP